MEFCPKCGGMILPQQVDDGENSEIVLKCTTCGYDSSEADKSEYSVSEKVESEETVIMRGDESGLRSTVREICPKCGHDRASYELLQTRSADEAPTRFFTCEKCGYKWRGYD